MKLLSYMTLAALLSFTSCAHKRDCCAKKEACCAKQEACCKKDQKQECKDGSCAKDKKECADGSCKKKS